MKKFKNTFGVTGSTHAINHFAELAVKEGWRYREVTNNNLLWFESNSGIHEEMNNAFWRPTVLVTPINISTPEGWNKALELMKEVEEEQLYGECLVDDIGNCFTKGKIYKIHQCPDFTNDYETYEDNEGEVNGFAKSNFKLVAESAYLEQEAKKETKYEFYGNKVYLKVPFQQETSDGFKEMYDMKEIKNISILQSNDTYNILISKEIKDKVTIKFE
jgi:hypothetical protein